MSVFAQSKNKVVLRTGVVLKHISTPAKTIIDVTSKINDVFNMPIS